MMTWLFRILYRGAHALFVVAFSLWGALLAAVAVLGGMAWRLFRAPSVPPDAST